ncbi:MAG: flagellin [Ruminococcus sp.]|jgi:flagellin|nr:flagellin [Ruminococcus sp.]
MLGQFKALGMFMLRQNNLHQLSFARSMERLSSGYRINRAADDAAGLAVSQKMRSQIAGLNQAVSNAADGKNMIDTFDGALDETHKILNRMKTLATQSANGIYDDEVDRAAIELEYEELLEELNDISDTDFNGKKMLDGTLDSLTLQVGSRTKDLKNFDMNFKDAWNTLDDPAAAKQKAIGNLTTDLNASSSGLGLNTSEVSLGSQTSANAAIDRIDQAINKISLMRASFGAVSNRLDHKTNYLNNTIENLTAAESRIRDVDFAKETMNLAREQMLMQVSQSLMAQLMQMQQGLLQLLQ